MRAPVAALVVASLLAGCVHGCPPHTAASFWEPGLFADLKGRAGVTTNGPAPGLPFDAASVDERWDGWALHMVRFAPNETWNRRSAADPIYAVQVFLVASAADRAPLQARVPEDGTHLVVEAHSSVPTDRVRTHVENFLATFGQPAPDDAWLDRLIASKTQAAGLRTHDGFLSITYGYHAPITPVALRHDDEQWPWGAAHDWDTPGYGKGVLFWDGLQYTFGLATRSFRLTHDGATAELVVAADDHVAADAPDRYDGVHERYEAWLRDALKAKGFGEPVLGQLDMETSVC